MAYLWKWKSWKMFQHTKDFSKTAASAPPLGLVPFPCLSVVIHVGVIANGHCYLIKSEAAWMLLNFVPSNVTNASCDSVCMFKMLNHSQIKLILSLKLKIKFGTFTFHLEITLAHKLWYAMTPTPLFYVIWVFLWLLFFRINLCSTRESKQHA